jgi:hypothetical protein
MREGLASARYALILDLECRRLSSCRQVVHSSQPHLHVQAVEGIFTQSYCINECIFHARFANIVAYAYMYFMLYCESPCLPALDVH